MLDKRKYGRISRRSLSPGIHELYSNDICLKIQDFITDKNVIMLYNSIDGEVDVSSLSHNTDKVIVLPRVIGDKMIAASGNEQAIGAFGIQEPVGPEYTGKIDAVIVPMCAFDRNFNRLGFGKGYYDRFLANKKALKIGVAFSCQEVTDILEKTTDIKMDVIITEKEILERVL